MEDFLDPQSHLYAGGMQELSIGVLISYYIKNVHVYWSQCCHRPQEVKFVANHLSSVDDPGEWLEGRSVT